MYKTSPLSALYALCLCLPLWGAAQNQRAMPPQPPAGMMAPAPPLHTATLLHCVGHAEKKTQPDRAVLRLSLQSTQTTTGKALSGVKERYQAACKRLYSLGFTDNDIRTVNLQVNPLTVYRNGSSFDSGFVATQDLEVEFPFLPERLGAVADAFGASSNETRCSFSFHCSLTLVRQQRDELLKQAYRDALQQAEVLSKAAGLEIKRVREIRKGTDASPNPGPFLKSMATMAETATFQPLEVLLSEDLTLVVESGQP